MNRNGRGAYFVASRCVGCGSSATNTTPWGFWLELTRSHRLDRSFRVITRRRKTANFPIRKGIIISHAFFICTNRSFLSIHSIHPPANKLSNAFNDEKNEKMCDPNEPQLMHQQKSNSQQVCKRAISTFSQHQYEDCRRPVIQRYPVRYCHHPRRNM